MSSSDQLAPIFTEMGALFERAARIVRAKLLRASGQVQRWAETAPDEEPSGTGTVDATQRANPRDRALAVLELAPGAEADEIRSAYRRLCRRYHPDYFSEDEAKAGAANELLSEINRAYELLSGT